MLPKAGDTPRTYRLENRIHVCTEKVPGYGEANPREHPSQYRGRGNTDELNGQVRSRKCVRLGVGWAVTNRDRYPYELTIPPHGDCLNHTPFPQPIISQGNPQKSRPSKTINVHEPESGAQEAKVIVDRFVGEVGYDGVRERGENVEGEYECC